MTTDTRTEAERAYDELKSGSAYVKPEPGAEFARGYQDGLALAQALIAEDETAIADWIDTRAPAEMAPPRARFPRDGTDADRELWRAQMRQVGSPEFNSLLDWIDEHFAKEEAETA